jgi:hypothetical protein
MPHDLSIVKAGEFIRLGSEGKVDFAGSRKMLVSLAQALVRRGVDKAILDVRRVSAEPPLTYTQLYELSKAFLEAGFGRQHRLAVLVAPSRYEKAEFFAICASGHGWNCFAFDTFEDAFDWLSETVELPPN